MSIDRRSELGPPIIKNRHEIYDPFSAEYVREVLPTKTVKFVGRKRGSADQGYTLGSVKVADGSALIVTRITAYFAAATQDAAEYALHDKNGTFMTLMTPNLEKPVVLTGSIKEPVCVLEGSSYTISAKLLGSFSAGTFAFSLEGIKDLEYIGKRG